MIDTLTRKLYYVGPQKREKDNAHEWKYSWGVTEYKIIGEMDNYYEITSVNEQNVHRKIGKSEVNTDKGHGFYTSENRAKEVFYSYRDQLQDGKTIDSLPPGLSEEICDKFKEILQDSIDVYGRIYSSQNSRRKK